MLRRSQQRCFYSNYDTGPESLPVDNQDQDSFQSKYLYFNGLSTLPRKPKPKHLDVDISNQVVPCDSNLSRNLSQQQGSMSQTSPAFDMSTPSSGGLFRATPSNDVWRSEAENQFHSLTLPRHPKRSSRTSAKGNQFLHHLDYNQNSTNRVRLLVQSFESQVFSSKETANANNTLLRRSDLNYLTISRGLTRSKKLERSRPVSSGQHVSKIFTERLFTEGPSSMLMPETPKKIPPKVAPKPRRFVTDILVSECARTGSHAHAHQQYLSLDCLDSTGDYHDSIYSLNSRASSVSGHKSSSSSTSSSSGHHSRSSTVSSAASIGGMFESKSCDSLLDPDTDSDNIEAEDVENNIKNESEMADRRQDDDHIQSTLSQPYSKPGSKHLPKLSRCEAVREIIGSYSGDTAMGDIDNYDGNNNDESDDVLNIRNNYARHQHSNEFPNMNNKMKIDLGCQMRNKLELMRTKESWLQSEMQDTLRILKRLEDKMVIVARTYEVDKLRLHIEEIEKIISLIVSLTYRLVPVENSLSSMDWNGVEERYELERRKSKLCDQLDEARLLWRSIKKRTGVVAGYIQQNLPFQDVLSFHKSINRRVEEILQLKELQEKIKETESQLKHVQS